MRFGVLLALAAATPATAAYLRWPVIALAALIVIVPSVRTVYDGVVVARTSMLSSAFSCVALLVGDEPPATLQPVMWAGVIVVMGLLVLDLAGCKAFIDTPRRSAVRVLSGSALALSMLALLAGGPADAQHALSTLPAYPQLTEGDR